VLDLRPYPFFDLLGINRSLALDMILPPTRSYQLTRSICVCTAIKWRDGEFANTSANSCPKERRIKRWEHEAILERVQKRLDADPDKISLRSKTVEHPFGTIKAWMAATRFKMKTLRHVATEMALHVLAYNMTRVMTLLGVPGLVKAMRS
jgi:hypothetical protein